MKKFSLLIAIIFSGILTEAQEQTTINYKRDTIWLKTGMVFPCLIIDDSTNNKYVYVNFLAGPESIEQSRFSWEHIKTIHQGSKPYIPKSATYRVELQDGTVLNGKLTSETETEIEIEMENVGNLTINRDKIKRLTPLVMVTPEVEQSFWYDNPQASRYFWSPNGYGLKAGEGYYQNVWVMFNQVAIGVTDNISLGGGVVPLFFFGGSTPVWITPKFSIPIVEDKLNVGGGALIGTVLGAEESGFGILYGLTTFGSRDKNITIGLGYGYVGGSLAKAPMININAMIRTGSKGYFLTENYYIPTGDGQLVLISLGGRRIINKSGLDFGLFIPFFSGMGGFIAIPWLGITVPFGNSNVKKVDPE